MPKERVYPAPTQRGKGERRRKLDSGNQRRPVPLPCVQQVIDELQELPGNCDDSFFLTELRTMTPEPVMKRRMSCSHRSPGCLTQNSFHKPIPMHGLSGFDLPGTLIIAWHNACPGTQSFRRRKILWRFGTDFCYNLHSGLFIEAGNGVDDC